MGVPMAIQASAHCELRNLLDDVHVFNASMTVGAVDSLVDVHTVVEIGIIGNAMDSLPGKRSSLVEKLLEFDDFRSILAGNDMTIHTGGDGRNHRMCGDGSARMTVLAIDPHCPRMEFMGKGDRLYRRIANPIPLSSGEIVGRRERKSSNKDNNWNADAECIVEKGFLHGQAAGEASSKSSLTPLCWPDRRFPRGIGEKG
jgi:hypothetical protein